MEIVHKKKPSCRFDEIDEAQCFVIEADDIDGVYMRTRVIINTDYTYAAVDLRTGQVYYFIPDQIVIPVEARLEIG